MAEVRSSRETVDSLSFGASPATLRTSDLAFRLALKRIDQKGQVDRLAQVSATAADEAHRRRAVDSRGQGHQPCGQVEELHNVWAHTIFGRAFFPAN